MEPLSQKLTDEDSGNIKILNDYCLLHIFEYLTIDDKLNAEEVCKRWKELCQKAWCHYQFKNLCIEQEAWNLPYDLFKDDSTTRKIILRLARYITSIDLSRPFPGAEKREISIQILLNVLKNSHKIDTFFLTYPFDPEKDSTNQLIKWLEHYAPQLMKFGYCHQSFILTDKVLFNLLKRMKNLKLLFIDSIIGDKFLKHLPDSLEELILENCGQIEVNSVLKAFKKSSTLHTFCSSGLTATDELEFLENSSIKNLGLTMSFSSDNPKWALAVCQLKNLEKLNIELNDNVDDNFLHNLTKYCKKLTFLSVSGCSNVTDEGTRYFNSLPNLNFLAVVSLKNVSGKYFGTMPNLEVLDCRNCPEITDVGLAGIVKFSTGLRVLNISGCKLITKQLIWNAVNVTRRRENNAILYISTHRTSINPKDFKGKSRLLKLKYQIHCKIECTSNYNGYFPTIHDFYHTSKPSNDLTDTKVYSYLKVN